MTKKDKIAKLSLIGIALLAFLTFYFIRFDSVNAGIVKNFGKAGTIKKLLTGLGDTLLITLVAFIIGIIVGLITCLVLGLKKDNIFISFIKQIFNIYIDIFRGTPMMVQLLIFYYIIFRTVSLNATFVAIIAFGLNSGAYVSEIIRGGINSVAKGQTEAGRSLGLPYSTVMGRVVFPQAIKNSFPSLGNEFITLLKETSIVGFVGAFDLTIAFKNIANATYDYIMVYLVMGIIYFVLILIITKMLYLIERRLNHGK